MATSVKPLFAVFVLAALIVGCSGSDGLESQSFVLYRNSVTDENMRIHVASFDAAEGEQYNRGNCE